MNFIIENWYLIFTAIVCGFLAGVGVYVFINYPTSTKMEKVKEWLLFAVEKAEEEFGSSTGQLKLRYVYNLFITRFPGLSKLISFETFSMLVDEALKKFKEMLIENKNLQKRVYGRELDENDLKKIKKQIDSK